MKQIKLILTLSITLMGFLCFAKDKNCTEEISIWKDVQGMEKEKTKMYLYQVESSEATPVVIICPGGSYHHHGMSNEGRYPARWFNSKGVTAFILKYRVSGQGYHYPAMMQDIQRAIQLVRENAEKYNIDTEKLGLIGFSAGGHLVAWAGEEGRRTNELEKIGIHTDVSLSPNWVAPIYPVVSMQDDIYHHWSRKSLLGTKKPSQEIKDRFSLELQVPNDMPPVYLVACHDDPKVMFENSKRFYEALIVKNVNVKFAEYEKGGHGFGMLEKDFMKRTHWNEDLAKWLQELDFMKE